MRIDFSELAPDTVEDWKQHPATQVLMQQLKATLNHWAGRLEKDASNAAKPALVASHGGRCAQLRQAIEEIKDAKGAKQT